MVGEAFLKEGRHEAQTPHGGSFAAEMIVEMKLTSMPRLISSPGPPPLSEIMIE
jgi:hypothetical protein